MPAIARNAERIPVTSLRPPTFPARPSDRRRRECDVVSIVPESAARILFDVRLLAVLGSRLQGLDCHRYGRVRATNRYALSQTYLVADKGDYYEIADGLPQNQH